MLFKLYPYLYGKTLLIIKINNKFFSSQPFFKVNLLQLSVSFLLFSYSVFNEHLPRTVVLVVGPSGLEPPTSCLSGTRSNLLSYEPMWLVSDFLSLELV